jgi:hypothetical protein
MKLRQRKPRDIGVKEANKEAHLPLLGKGK